MKNHFNKKSFFSHELNNIEVNDQDYRYAHRVQNKFNIDNLGEYQDLTMLLMCSHYLMCFRTLETKINKKCDLDPISFVTVPPLSLMSALKKAKRRTSIINQY